MKLDALEHPKILDFAARLGVTRPTALGHLELLYAFTGKHSPQGDIGKWPAGAVARASDWMGDPKCFLQSLLQSGLIDADPVHQYVVHDWHDHAPRWVRAKLAKAKLAFISSAVATTERTTVATSADDDLGEDDDVRTVVGSAVATAVASSKGSEEKRSEEKRSHTERARAASPVTNGNPGFDAKADHEAFERVKAAYPKFAGRQDWINAESACHIRLDEGETWESLLAAAERYAKHIRAKGSEGTQYVLTPGKFFSAADEPWKQDWPIPVQRPNGAAGAQASTRGGAMTHAQVMAELDAATDWSKPEWPDEALA